MVAVAVARRAGRFVLGIVLGVVLVALVLFVWIESMRPERLGRLLLERVALPAEVLRLEDVTPEGVLRVSARNVLLLDLRGDTVAHAPRAHFSVDAEQLLDDGPFVLRDVVLERPYLNLVELPDGTLNLDQVVRVTVDDRVIDPEPGRGVLLQNVRIQGGRARWVTPWTPEEPLPPQLADAVRLTRVNGTPARVRTLQALDAQLPAVRFGGPEGWRVQIAAATAQLTDPELRVLALRGVVEAAPDDGIRFDIALLRTERSELAARGTVRPGADPLQFDVELHARPLAFPDLRWFVPQVPAEGQAAGSFALASAPGERITLSATDMVVTALDSRVAGRLHVEFGGDRPAVFRDTRLELDPLRIETVERLGFVDEVPYAGEVRGVLATTAPVELEQGTLSVDLRATVVPRALAVPPSLIVAQGEIGFGATDAPLRFAGLRVQTMPLHLAALTPLLPEQEERLRGVLRSDAVLTGTTRELTVAQGTLEYEIPGEAPIRLSAVTAELAFEPVFTFDLRAEARPLPLGTLAALVPGLPFERATLAGPMRAAGTADDFTFDVDLRGAAGAFAARGRVVPGETPLRFDVTGRVEAFQPTAVLARQAPETGPLTGTFTVAGTSERFDFDVDLEQALGRFALRGWVRDPAGAPALEVTGEVFNFQVGTVIGQPLLFPSPLTGAIAVRGGGGQPFVYDVDLTGPAAALVLRGWYVHAPVPEYAAVGHVAGLGVHRLPGARALPPTVLTATVDLLGRGTTVDEFAGRLALVGLPGTAVAGFPVETLQTRLAVADGVLTVDTLAANFAGARLDAGGTWGLTRPALGALRVAFVSQDLSRLGPVIGRVQGLQPLIEGAIAVNAVVAGTLERPLVTGTARGRNLRYEGWRAGVLAADVNAQFAPDPDEWFGTLVLNAENARLRGTLALESLRLEASAAAGTIGVGLLARRDRQTDLALSGAVEMVDRVPRGVLLESFALRLEEMDWRLERPSRIEWDPDVGLAVHDLMIRRVDIAGGLVVVDGRLPAEGQANLRVQLAQLDLDVVRRLVPETPTLRGLVDAELLIDGPVEAPEVLVTARAENLRVEETEADLVLFGARYANQLLVVDTATVQLDGRTVAALQAQLPMQLSLAGLSPELELLDVGPLQARMVLDSLPLGLVVAAVPDFSRGDGFVAGELEAGGTVANPVFAGSAHVLGGAVTIDPLNIRYHDIAGRVTLQNDEIRFDSLGMRSGVGGAVASGWIRPSTEGSLVDVAAEFRSFRAADHEDFQRLTLTGRAALTGRFPAPTLTGEIRVDEAIVRLPNFADEPPLELVDIDIGQIGADTIATPLIGPPFLAGVRMDGVLVSLGDNVWVQNNELRAQLTADEVLVFREAGLMRVFGDIVTARGTYRLQVGPLIREFDIVSGRIGFVGTADLNPELDILASHDIRTGRREGAGPLRVLVHVTGTVESPRVDLTSDTQPPLHPSDILSYLVFGRPSFALGPELGAAALAQQVVLGEIVGGLALIQLEELLLQRWGLPFDQVRVRGRPELLGGGSPFAGTTIEFSDQIVRNVFWTLDVGVEGVFGGRPQLGTSLLWQIDPNLTASIAIEPVREVFRQQLPEVPYQFTAELRRQWEFGRPPAQPLDFEELPSPVPLAEPPPPPP